MENKKDNFGMKFIFALFLVIGIIVYPVTSFAESSVSFDKKSYIVGDKIKISGRVVFEENVPIVIQVRSISDIVAIKQFFPLKSGSFSTEFDASGPKWTQSGTYTVIISYGDERFEKTFSFSITSTSEKKESEQTKQIEEKIQSQKPKAKISISDFPDTTLSPNYYINLYNTDSDFKKLFDTSFPGYQIQELVESIVEEKWEDLMTRFGDLNLWKENVNNDLEAIKQEILRTRENFNNLQNMIVGKVTNYNRSVSELGSEMKALEQVMQKIIQPLTTNVKELSKITSELKEKKSKSK